MLSNQSEMQISHKRATDKRRNSTIVQYLSSNIISMAVMCTKGVEEGGAKKTLDSRKEEKKQSQNIQIRHLDRELCESVNKQNYIEQRA